MNKYFKIFLTVMILTAGTFLFSLGYGFLRMTDTMFNIGGLLLITATALGVFWCLYQFWVKPIPSNASIFDSVFVEFNTDKREKPKTEESKTEEKQ